MKRLQAIFSRHLQNTLSLLEQPDLGSPAHTSHTFTHKKPLKQNPIQIITKASGNPHSPQPNNSKSKPKRISPGRQASIPKRRAPPRKPKKANENNNTLSATATTTTTIAAVSNSSSILKTPISPSDPNIQSMFTLFCLERAYRKKCLERVFNVWYRKMTRQLLLRLRRSHDDTLAPFSLQSSSLVQINSVSTLNQLTQTEYMTSDSDSDPFGLTSDDNISEIDELSDTQLITSIISRKNKSQQILEDNLDENDDQNNQNSIFKTNSNINSSSKDDFNDDKYDNGHYDRYKNDRSEKNRNNRIQAIKNSFDGYEKDNKEDNTAENPAESSFLSWKANSMIKKVLNQSCDLVANVLEAPVMSSENSQTYSETTEEYIPIPMSSDHSETIDTSNSMINKSRDSGSDSFSNEIEANAKNTKSTKNTKNTAMDLKKNDSTSDIYISAPTESQTKLNQAMLSNLNNTNADDISSITEKNNVSNSSFNEKTITPERKIPPVSKKSSQSDKSAKSSSPMPVKNSENAHVSLKERFRPTPINPNAEIVKKVVDDFKTYQKVALTAKPENELKRFLRQFFSEELFESIKSAQLKEKQIPFIKIPPNIQKPWQFTEEYCDLIVDVVTEIAESSNMVNYNYESFLEYLSNFFEKAHNQRQKTVLPELESFRQKKFDEFLVNYSLDVADSFLHFQLDSVLGV